MSFVAIPDTVREDEAINSLSDRAHRFWSMLLPQVDAWGRITANPELLRSYVWPLTGRTAAETEKALSECAKVGLLTVNKTDAAHWTQILKWDETYRPVGAAPSKRPKSRYPDTPALVCDPPALVCKDLPGSCIGMQTPAMGSQLSGVGSVPVPVSVSVPVSVEEPEPFEAVLAEEDFVDLRANPDFHLLLAFWPDWDGYRREIKKPMGVRGIREQLRYARDWGVTVWIERARASIANGWQGVFPEKAGPGMRGPGGQMVQMTKGEVATMRAIQFARNNGDLT
jgi:hypothetical protein